MTLTLDSTARTARHARMYIGGQWVPAADTFPTVDPNTGATIGEVPRGSAADVDRAVAAATGVAVEWQFTDALGRAALLRALAEKVTENADELARLEAVHGYTQVKHVTVDLDPLRAATDWAGAPL